MEQTYDDMLPNPGFSIDKARTAVVITDPQKDFLSEDGVVWAVVGTSVEENQTVEHLKQLLTAAHEHGMPVFISPPPGCGLGVGQTLTVEFARAVM